MSSPSPSRIRVVVVGGGHAGCEAALVCARMGIPTMLLTPSLDRIAVQPCNPSVGGPGKGHLVREVDALGGEIGLNTDATSLQKRYLNTRKGLSVRSLRAQTDKLRYGRRMRRVLESTPGLLVKESMVSGIEVEGGRVVAVETLHGLRLSCEAVIVASGTFLNGILHIGHHRFPAGRDGEFPSVDLAACLAALGLRLGRLKTGTPPRVDRRSIDFAGLEVQDALDLWPPFSYLNDPVPATGLPCYVLRTNETTHRIVRENLQRSALYGGRIEGTGPRYCPSIEVKIVNFPEKDSHLVYLEPEGKDSEEIYVQGMSTSLPEDVQLAMIRSLPGMEKARIMRPGYAIEYDFADPSQLQATLECRELRGLYLAGQICGTSGYEEAAAQGMLAGINAARAVAGEAPFVLGRDQAYMGVMVDDLIHKGVDEPYRIFTSRAEYRLLLRQDNADLRLTPLVLGWPHVSDARARRFRERRRIIADQVERLEGTFLHPTPSTTQVLESLGSSPLRASTSLADLLKRPEITLGVLARLGYEPGAALTEDVAEEITVRIKFAGYIRKQQRQVEDFRRLERRLLPADVDYEGMTALSYEARKKLSAARPRSIGEASRIPGVRMSDALLLLGWLQRQAEGEGGP